MKPPHWRCRGCGIIITDCGSAPSVCRFCQSTAGFEYVGYEGDYDLHKETEMYRALHETQQPEEAKGPIFSNSENSTESPLVINLLKNIDTKVNKKKEMKKPKLVRIDLDKPITDLVGKTDHKILGIWAADCAERVLPYFEKKYPDDNRPRKAIDALRAWVQTGRFKMVDIRRVSLAAHAAAREVSDEDVTARSAARAAGQAVATAHVPTHAVGAAVYAATAVRDATGSIDDAAKERDWQYQHLVELNKTFGSADPKTLWRSRTK